MVPLRRARRSSGPYRACPAGQTPRASHCAELGISRSQSVLSVSRPGGAHSPAENAPDGTMGLPLLSRGLGTAGSPANSVDRRLRGCGRPLISSASRCVLERQLIALWWHRLWAAPQLGQRRNSCDLVAREDVDAATDRDALGRFHAAVFHPTNDGLDVYAERGGSLTRRERVDVGNGHGPFLHRKSSSFDISV